jgi:hypothetical protein
MNATMTTHTPTIIPMVAPARIPEECGVATELGLLLLSTPVEVGTGLPLIKAGSILAQEYKNEYVRPKTLVHRSQRKKAD